MREQGGVPWGWVAAGAGTALALGIGIGIGVWFAIRMTAPPPTNSSSAAVTESKTPLETNVNAAGRVAAIGPALSGRWLVHSECRDRSERLGPLVDFGFLAIDPATATAQFKNSSTPAPVTGEVRVSDGQLLFRWKETASADYNTLSGRLIDQKTMKGSLIFVSRPTQVCTFEAKKG
jgi:hypothetical protein